VSFPDRPFRANHLPPDLHGRNGLTVKCGAPTHGGSI
jgi:hypothetical protein